MWQQELFRKLDRIAKHHEAIVAIRPFGSVADGVVDVWSDLDVELKVDWDRLADVFPSTAWLNDLGEIYAVSTEDGSDVAVTRVVFRDCRQLDLRMIRADSIADSSSSTVPPADPGPQIGQLRNEFLFEAIKAITKIGRSDVLIGGHLVLALEQKVLVLAMILRDQHFQTTVHREGGEFNNLASQVLGGSMDRESLLNRIAASANAFDHLAKQLDPTFSQDWSPLDHCLEQARHDDGIYAVGGSPYTP